MTTAKGRWRVAAIAALAVAVVYAPARRFDLFWDDFLVLRPWTHAELWSALTSSWEPWHVFPAFYRPIGALFYAASFALVGINTHALFLIACANLVALGWMAGVFVARETGSLRLGAAATVIYLCHPALVSSVGIWYTNQFHALATFAVIGALLLWQRCRTAPAAAWWPLAAIVAAGGLVKEDTLMIAPALVTLQAIRARTIGDVPRPARGLAVGAVVVVVAMLGVRTLMLRGIGGFPLPSSPEWALRDLLRGPYYVLSGAPDVSDIGMIVAGVVLIVLTGLAVRASARDRWLLVLGAVLLAWCNAPLILVSNVSRYHLLTLASAFMIAGGLQAALSLARRRGVRRDVPAAVLALTLAAMIASSRVILASFAPCSTDSTDGYDYLLRARDLPPEMLDWFHERLRACEPYYSIRTLDVLTWGGHRLDAGAPLTTIGEHATLLVRRGALVLHLQARVPGGIAGPHPSQLQVEADGTPMTSLDLATSWRSMDVPLDDGGRGWRSWVVWLRDGHRVTLRVNAQDRGAGADVRTVTDPRSAPR